MENVGRVVWIINAIGAALTLSVLVAGSQPEPTPAPGYELREIPPEWESRAEPCPDGRPHVGTFNVATGKWLEVHCP